MIFVHGQEIVSNPQEKNSIHYVSVGFLDHKTGTSLVGYARTIKKFNKHELFIGAGTVIAAVTFSAGWKYYLSDSPLQFYSVVSVQNATGMGGSFIAPFISLGIEKRITKKIYFNLGLNTTIRVYPDRPVEFVMFPNFNINFRY